MTDDELATANETIDKIQNWIDYSDRQLAEVLNTIPIDPTTQTFDFTDNQLSEFEGAFAWTASFAQLKERLEKQILDHELQK